MGENDKADHGKLMYTKLMANNHPPLNESEIIPNKQFNCPYIGLESDPTTLISFPNTANYCHKTKPARPVDTEHQRQFCLTEAYPICKIFQQHKTTPLPKIVAVEPRREKNPLRFFWISLSFLAVITLLVLAAFWVRSNWSSLFNNGFSISPQAGQTTSIPALSYPTAVVATPIPSDTPTLDLPLAVIILTPEVFETQSDTPTPLPTATSSPTPTPVPSSTQLTPGPALNTPFGPDQQFLLHKVVVGESLGNVAVLYRTSADVIRASNVLIEGASLWPDTILVILPGVTDLSQVQKFQVIQLKTPILPEDLAKEYQVNLEELLEYNKLDAEILIPAGRWLILPVNPS